jgi:four helix bundle protein
MVKHEYDLERRTLAFAKSVLRLCKNLPGDTTNREIISQVIRSSGSIGANYREANDVSKKDFSHRIKITRKEAKETEYWLELLWEGNPGHVDKINELLSESIELKKMLSSIAEKTSRLMAVASG